MGPKGAGACRGQQLGPKVAGAEARIPVMGLQRPTIYLCVWRDQYRGRQHAQMQAAKAARRMRPSACISKGGIEDSSKCQ